MKSMSAAVALVVAIAAAPTMAVDEVEPNNSLLTAQSLGSPTPGAFPILGSLTVGDVDYFGITLPANTLLGVSIFDFTPNEDFDNDSFIGLFNSAGMLLISDDDSGPGFMSQYAIILPDAGTYFIAFTGFGDDNFVGDHDESFSYKAVVVTSVVPAPAGLATLAGLLAIGRSRHRR